MRNKIKYLNFYFLVIICIFCFNSCCDNNNEAHNIQYYYRNEGSTNGYTTYHDYLIVDNYKDGIMSIKQFQDIAKKYIDTVKADKAVSGITFVGKSPCGKLPKGNWDNWEKQKKYFIIIVAFDNGFERNKDKKDIQTDFISIYGKNDTSYTTQPQIDSLLNLQSKLFTGF